MTNALKKKLILARNYPSEPMILDYLDEALRGAIGIERQIDCLEDATITLMQRLGESEVDAEEMANNASEELYSRLIEVWTQCLLAAETPATFEISPVGEWFRSKREQDCD